MKLFVRKSKEMDYYVRGFLAGAVAVQQEDLMPAKALLEASRILCTAHIYAGEYGRAILMRANWQLLNNYFQGE